MDSIPTSELGVRDFKSAIGATPIAWPVDSTVQLCNVPWDSEYANIVQFESADARDAYFNGLSSESITLSKLTYCFPNAPVHINIEYSKAYTYNYLAVTNPKLPTDTAQPVKFFYFINNVIYTAPNTTSLELQLDVWTTYQFNVKLGRAFVERGHVAWHGYANQTVNATRPPLLKQRYLSQPEGLDVGNSYTMSNMTLSSMGGGLNEGETEWTIIIVSAVDLENGSKTLDDFFGTEKAPKLKMAEGMVVDGLPSACNVYGMEVHNFAPFVKAISGYPWISTNILSITAVPEGVVIHNGDTKIAGVNAYRVRSQGTFSTEVYNGKSLTNQVSPVGNLEVFLTGTSIANWKKHPKSRVFPFTYLVCDNWCSQPLTLKPELFRFNNITFQRVYCVTPPFCKLAVFPVSYGNAGASEVTYTKYRMGNTSSETFKFPAGYTLNNALIWDDMPQFSILNDEYIGYMASNARTIAWQRDNAGWNLDKAKAGAQLSYDNSMRSISAATQSQAEQRQFELTRASKTSNAAYLNALSDQAGKIGDAFGASTKQYIQLAQNSIAYTTGRAQSDLGQTQFEINKAAQTENAGANYKTQMWAAKGDYQQAIAQINATCQDASILPPSQSGTQSGGMYAVLGQLGATNWQIAAFTVVEGYQKLISDYWDRFGYAVNDYMVPSKLQLMTNFTYWKMQDLVVGGTSLPEQYRMVIKGIFEKGVTVYSTPAKIEGDITVITGNEPVKSTPLY